MGHSVREARGDDAATLASLAGALGYPCDARQMRERLAQVAATPEHRVLVVTDESDAPLGWIHAVEGARLTAGTFVEIVGLVVAESRRGAGLGQALVEAVVLWARQRGVASLRVNSRTSREGAHRFYTRLGFSPVKTQQVFRRRLD